MENAGSNVVRQRTVRSRVLTPAGWVRGALRLQESHRILDHLNTTEPFFRMTDVQLPLRQGAHPFFAVGRGSMMAVVPEEETDAQELLGRGGRVVHSTSWLLPGGIILDGLMDLDEGERVSDHLVHKPGFVVLRECSVVFPHGGIFLPGEFSYPVVALQSSRAVGVTELTDPVAR
jgi:hypothetical protein